MAVTILLPHGVWAQLTSPSYRVEETFFGTGGELEANSTNYHTKQSAGELGVGNVTSSNYQANSGFNTDRPESLEFVVSGTNIDLGVLSGTTTTTTTFTVKAYLAHGYVVQATGDPPATPSHTLANLTSPTASAAGTEQFGMNLVANTTPSVGANPVQLPDSSFSFGTAASGYDTPNLFKYVKNDVVAHSTKSSGTTQYTISYLYNTASTTPSGTYTFRQDLVATATY
jgi:hypothetical protein